MTTQMQNNHKKKLTTSHMIAQPVSFSPRSVRYRAFYMSVLSGPLSGKPQSFHLISLCVITLHVVYRLAP